MPRRFNPWLSAYAISMTLVAAWLLSCTMVDRALLAWTHGFAEYRGWYATEGHRYYQDPSFLAERGFSLALASDFSRNGPVLIALLIPIISYLCWYASRHQPTRLLVPKPQDKSPTDLSLE